MAKIFGIVDIEEAKRLAFIVRDTAYSNGVMVSRYGYKSEEAQTLMKDSDHAMNDLLDALKGTVNVETAADKAYEEDED